MMTIIASEIGNRGLRNGITLNKINAIDAPRLSIASMLAPIASDFKTSEQFSIFVVVLID